MELHTMDDASTAYAHAARHVSERIAAISKRKGTCVLGIVGGRTTEGILGALERALPHAQGLHVFWLDERIGQEKNHVLAVPFLDRLHARTHPILAQRPEEARAEIATISKELDALGGFDIIVVSAGEDGHIASIFPEDDILDAHGRGYALVHSPKPPPVRATVTPPTIAGTEAVLFFIGDGKREAYARFMDPATTVHACPAKLLLRAPTLHVYVAL